MHHSASALQTLVPLAACRWVVSLRTSLYTGVRQHNIKPVTSPISTVTEIALEYAVMLLMVDVLHQMMSIYGRTLLSCCPYMTHHCKCRSLSESQLQ